MNRYRLRCHVKSSSLPVCTLVGFIDTVARKDEQFEIRYYTLLALKNRIIHNFVVKHFSKIPYIPLAKVNANLKYIQMVQTPE